MPRTAPLVADVASPGEVDAVLGLGCLVFACAPLLFGLLILGAAHLHRRHDRSNKGHRP